MPIGSYRPRHIWPRHESGYLIVHDCGAIVYILIDSGEPDFAHYLASFAQGEV